MTRFYRCNIEQQIRQHITLLHNPSKVTNDVETASAFHIFDPSSVVRVSLISFVGKSCFIIVISFLLTVRCFEIFKQMVRL